MQAFRSQYAQLPIRLRSPRRVQDIALCMATLHKGPWWLGNARVPGVGITPVRYRTTDFRANRMVSGPRRTELRLGGVREPNGAGGVQCGLARFALQSQPTLLPRIYSGARHRPDAALQGRPSRGPNCCRGSSGRRHGATTDHSCTAVPPDDE